MKKNIIYLIIFLLLTNIVLAQNIEVIKEAPQEIKLNEIIEIKIHISNPSNTEKEFTIEEFLPQNIEVIEPKTTFTKRNDALVVNYYEWITLISPNKIKTITYKIKPLSLGEYTIRSTQVIDKSNLNTYESNSINFKVNCIPNNICENNENSITCSEDCKTGGSDGICDYQADDICDPDCEDEPDCKKQEINILHLIIPFIIIIFTFLLIWLWPKIFKKKDEFPIQEEKQTIKYAEHFQKSNQKEQDPLAGI